ncbi:MAG: hypothetical protein JXB14_02655 [Candidatus Altiarchaeota archaeon]|nr:hypothetical protein [Candidatus Altiarchaeota archaeon]
MAFRESEKRQQIGNILRLTHPTTIKRVREELKKAGASSNKKAYLKSLLEKEKDRDLYIEEYVELTKFQKAIQGESMNEQELRVLIDGMTGDALLDVEMSKL